MSRSALRSVGMLAATMAAVVALFGQTAQAKAPAGGGEILWDSYGVPHIYAKSEEGAFYGFGWAQAQSHGNILLKMYGESRGRGAEYWGESGEALSRWVVANDVPERSRIWYRQQTPQMRANLDAFAEGVNDYAAAHPDKIDAEMKRVLPLSGVDILQHAHRLMNYNYIASERRALSNPAEDGSNAWAVAPSRSASGNTMVLANPHLPWSPSMLTYYEAHLNAPGLMIYGGTQVGLPVIRFAFNNNISFTNTVNTILGYTTYKLTLADGGYLFDGKVRPFETVAKSYKVRQADGSLKTVNFEQRIAVQGPVFELPGNGGTVAVRVAGLDRPGALQQYLDMGKSQNWEQFSSALRRHQVPTFNIVYGDRDGHILYLDNGILPKHAAGGDFNSWNRPVPGDTSATLWTEVHPFDDMPMVLDPPTGYVQNANDPPWLSTYPRVLDPAKYPPYVAVVGPMSQRAQLSNKLMIETPKLGFDDFVRRKTDTTSLMAERMLPDLLAAAASSTDPDVVASVALLQSWDRRMEADAKAALLFETWAGIFAPNNFTSQDNYAVKWTIDDPLETPRGLKDPAAAVAMLQQAAVKTRELYGRLDRPFGEVSRFRIGDVDLPGHGSYGNLGIFPVITWSPLKDGTRTPLHGETWISMVEFSTPLKAVGLMTYGNSSQPGSKHNNDQLHLLANKSFRTLWIERADIERNLEARQEF